MIVTTTDKAGAEMASYARNLAEELECLFVNRGRESLTGLMRKRQDAADGILVAGHTGLRFVSDDAPPLFYHPSMALIRVKRLMEGGGDALVTAAGVVPGDVVLDCTAGLGADALVLAYAVGDTGQVTAVEASRMLHLIVREGWLSYETEIAALNAAMRRIRAVHGSHLSYLQTLPDDSVDVICFDPMFSQPVLSSSSIRPLRAFAEDEPLDPLAVAEARRVARKRIVLKEHKESNQFEIHGFTRVRSSYSAVDYGVIRLNESDE